MTHKWDTDFASENPEHAKIAPATGPDTRQPDMVCRAKVIEILEQNRQEAEDKLTKHRGKPHSFYVTPNCVQLKVSALCERLIEKVRKL